MVAGWMPNISMGISKKEVDLSEVRNLVGEHFGHLSSGNIYGKYSIGIDAPVDLYASCDVAIARHIMGEDLVGGLLLKKRQEWAGYINSYQQPEDGSYTERFNHSKLHANGMTVGALGVIGLKQKYPVKLYEEFNSIEKVVPWLEQIDWAKQWSASHQFWGGIHCYSLSSQCTEEWLDVVFEWLNKRIDEQTGWWKKGVPHTDRHQPLGGSVHILPIYEHHKRAFPYPERVIDSVLALQLPNGRWLSREKDSTHVMHYLELDALYALRYMNALAPDYRVREIQKSVERYSDLVFEYWNNPSLNWKSQHPHRILSMVGTFGLLQKLAPQRFYDTNEWTDIFSDIKLYNTASVEVLP